MSNDSVVAEIEIGAPIERVFAALTDPGQLFTWWGTEPSVTLSLFQMDARPGGLWRFECTPIPGADHGELGEQLKRYDAKVYEAHGEVLEYDPPRRLVWSWIANWHDLPEETTIVRWDLTPTVDGTHVRVTHSRLENQPIARKDYSGGWPGVLRLLKAYLFGSGLPPDAALPPASGPSRPTARPPRSPEST
jgi:uncharacterized protein YndB with AHSA1/START domain